MNNQIYDKNNKDRVLNKSKRIEEMRRNKRRQQRVRRLIKRIAAYVIGFICIFIMLFTIVKLISKSKKDADIPVETSIEADTDNREFKKDIEEKDVEEKKPIYSPTETEKTVELGDDIISNYAILIDLSTDSISARKNAKTVINPASMTKILTVLVAAEHVTNLDDTFTMKKEILDYCYKNDCSIAEFNDGEKISIRDLFYATILPSGGEAALGLATYVAGSQEAFVEMMNKKLEELGLSQSAHFTNCIGIYDEEHYCSVYDMAIILKAAVENNICLDVLSTHTYTTSKTLEHPEGIIISNWFLRRIEDKDTGCEVICGKTGYVVESKNCAASYGKDSNGNEYICVTAGASSGWRCIYDHVAIYKNIEEGEKNK